MIGVTNKILLFIIKYYKVKTWNKILQIKNWNDIWTIPILNFKFLYIKRMKLYYKMVNRGFKKLYIYIKCKVLSYNIKNIIL